jgi:hypothetical protein
MRYAQLVMGPAGSGKSTYCAAVAAHAQVSRIISSLMVSEVLRIRDVYPGCLSRILIFVHPGYWISDPGSKK